MQPIFVVGSPRSGTTMMGSMIGSDPDVKELGEFMAFFVVGHYLQNIHADSRSSYRSELVEHMLGAAHNYASMKAVEDKCGAYIDDTPLNALMIPLLEKLHHLPLYVCMVRSIPGVIKSLEKSFHSGREWAGKDNSSRVSLWTQFYTACNRLPDDRTIFVSYEDFILNPKENIGNIRSFFRSRGIPLDGMDLSVLSRNHATGSNDNSFIMRHDGPVPSETQKEKVLNSIEASPVFREMYAHVIGQVERNILAKVTHFSPQSI